MYYDIQVLTFFSYSFIKNTVLLHGSAYFKVIFRRFYQIFSFDSFSFSIIKNIQQLLKSLA